MPADLESIDWLMNATRKHQLLTADEEIIYCRHIKAWLPIRDIENPTPQQRAIIRRGQKAYERFYHCNVKLVVHIASRYVGVGGALTIEDLVQEGLIGLGTAITGFDAERGYKFSTYAYWWVRQAINRAISKQSRVIRLPCDASAKMRKAREFTAEFYQKHGRNPPLATVAQACEITEETLRNYLPHTAHTTSLDAKMRCDINGEAGTYLDMLADQLVQDEAYLEGDVLDILPKLLRNLADRDREVIQLYYGMTGQKPMSFREIAEGMGVTRERVRQMHIRAMRVLRIRLNVIRQAEAAS